MAKAFKFVHKFIHDESGSYLVFLTILMPVLIGVAALGTEGAYVLTQHRAAQAAADSAAVSVASYYAAQYNPLLPPTLAKLNTQAQAVLAAYVKANPGMSGATATVIWPPTPPSNFTTSNWTNCGNGGNGNCAFEVIVSQSHSPLLSGIYLPNAITVSARAVALISTSGIGRGGSSASCVLALGNSSVGGPANLAEAITANGNARLNLQGCSIGTNSSADGGGSSDAIYFGSGGSAAINLIEPNGIVGGRVSAVGGVSIAGSVQSCTSVSGSTCNDADPVTPLTGAAATPNPDAGVTIPLASTCLPVPTGNPTVSQCTKDVPNSGWCISGSTTLSPGTYCGGINISGGTVTLTAGVYVLASTAQNETGMTMSNGTTLTGATAAAGGNTLVFTSTDGISYPSASGSSGCSTAGTCMMDIANGATVNLTAPTSGLTAGFVIMGDRSMPVGTVGQSGSSQGSQFVIENGATATLGTLGGVVYLPNGALSFEGAGTATTGCTQIIANVFDLSSSGSLNENCTTNSSGGIGPGSLPSTLIGAIPLLVE